VRREGDTANALVEHLLYFQPLILRVAKNIYAFWADAFVLIFSLPVCRIVDSKIREYLVR